MNKHDLENMIYNLESRKNLKSVTLTQKAVVEVLGYLNRLQCLELELNKTKKDFKLLKEKYKNKMQQAIDNDDEEVGHIDCDYVLQELVEELGFKEVTDLYNDQNKWYC